MLSITKLVQELKLTKSIQKKQELRPQFWFGGRYISGPIKSFVLI